MTAADSFAEKMAEFGDIAPALEHHLHELGFDPHRLGTIGGSGLAWGLWPGTGQTSPPMVLMDSEAIYVYYHRHMNSTTYELADPESIKDMDDRLACILQLRVEYK